MFICSCKNSALKLEIEVGVRAAKIDFAACIPHCQYIFRGLHAAKSMELCMKQNYDSQPISNVNKAKAIKAELLEVHLKSICTIQ